MLHVIIAQEELADMLAPLEWSVRAFAGYV
jgi:hypothetical protein